MMNAISNVAVAPIELNFDEIELVAGGGGWAKAACAVVGAVVGGLVGGAVGTLLGPTGAAAGAVEGACYGAAAGETVGGEF